MLLLICLIVPGLLLLPLTLQVDGYHFESSELRIRLSFAGLHKTWSRREAPGTLNLPSGRRKRFLSLFLRARTARRYLLQHIRLVHLDGQVRLYAADAAHTALLSGMLQGVAALVPQTLHPRIRLRILPEFFLPRSTLAFRCIIRPRLGTLILTAAMLALHLLRSRRLKESEVL